MKDAGISPCFCLNPVNNSLFLIADNKGQIKMLNMSTGKVVFRVKALSNVTALQFDPLGHLLFAGDEKGLVEVYKYTKDGGENLQLVNRNMVGNGKAITSLSFKGIHTNQQYSPSILISCRDNTLKVFVLKNTPAPGSLVLIREFPVLNKKEVIHSCWCPLVDSTTVVSGCDDGNIYIFDLKKKEKPCINTLMGHSGAVVDVSWSYDESLLASCDVTGMVILWARRHINNETK